MIRAFAAGALCLIVPAVCLGDAPSRGRSKATVSASQLANVPAPESRAGSTARVVKVFKVFGDDDDTASGAAPRKARKSRKSRGAKRPAPRKPRLTAPPTAEPAGILDLIGGCPELLKM